VSDSDHLPDSVLLGPQEAGFPAHEGPMISSLPAGMGKGAFPHFLSFSELVNFQSRSYRWNHDEALRHSTANALAMRRDPIVMSALRARQIPVSQLSWHIDCQNPEDMRQSAAAKLVTDLIKRTPRLQQMMMCLLEAVFYGRYAIQISYGWDFSDGKRRMVVKDFKPINGDKMAFRWSGNAGILVHALFEGDWEITERGRTHFFTDYERDQIVIHKHEPEDADFFEASLAGGVHGVGIRSRIYWFWYLRSQTMSFLMDYLERMGAGGLTIAYYEHGNPQSLEDVKSCMENQFKNHTILFPRYRDTTTGGPGIERIEPSNNGAQLLESLVTNYFDAQIRRLILGQDLTSQAGPGGSDGVATLHGETFNRIIKYDAVALQDTLTQDFVRILQKYNVPHDIPPLRFMFDVDKVNAGEMLEAANQFYQMGGSIDEDELRTTIGLSRPKQGGAVLTQNMPMNPATLGTVPQGTPMEGMPAPDLGAPVQMSRVKYQQQEGTPQKIILPGRILDDFSRDKAEIMLVNRKLRNLMNYKAKPGEDTGPNSNYAKAIKGWEETTHNLLVSNQHAKYLIKDIRPQEFKSLLKRIKSPEDFKQFMLTQPGNTALQTGYIASKERNTNEELHPATSQNLFGDTKGFDTTSTSRGLKWEQKQKQDIGTVRYSPTLNPEDMERLDKESQSEANFYQAPEKAKMEQEKQQPKPITPEASAAKPPAAISAPVPKPPVAAVPKPPVAPKPVAVAPRPAPRPIVAAPAPAPAPAPKLAAAPRLPIPVAPKPLVAAAPKPAPNLGQPQPGAV